MDDLQVFIGYDSTEDEAYQVAKASILEYTDIKVTPLKLKELSHLYNKTDMLASTEFTMTRFLVPYLSEYQGLSLFMDCDILVRTNIRYILDYVNRENWVSVVQHDYTPKTKLKMDGKLQTEYPRKNWSSVMLFNNEKCRHLTPALINNAEPSYLHQLKWVSDKNVGSLPVKWNYLVGYYNNNRDYANVLHYTDGGPWHKEWKGDNEDYDKEWLRQWQKVKDN